jgi:hypothetical protein
MNYVLLVLEVEQRVIEMIKGTTDQDGSLQNTLLAYLMMFQF